VLTRDGKEYLIPNEDLITQRVINWSFSNDLIRQHVKFGIGYLAGGVTAWRRLASRDTFAGL
jgi:small-conductance mechanosensitive channel